MIFRVVESLSADPYYYRQEKNLYSEKKEILFSFSIFFLVFCF